MKPLLFSLIVEERKKWKVDVDISHKEITLYCHILDSNSEETEPLMKDAYSLQNVMDIIGEEKTINPFDYEDSN